MTHAPLPTLAAAFGVLLAPPAEAQEITLGDVAPALDVTHWMKGEEVTTFAPGRVYVLEFWATWCGPCVANMEHLSVLQEKYAARGVTVIGLSDEPLQTTVAFLLKRHGAEGVLQNDRTRYALATDPDRSVHAAYFEAAGLSGIPAVFVIGKDGRIDWLGHPKDLDPVLAAVVEGTWDREAHRAATLAEQVASRALREARRQYSKAFERADWETALDALDRLIATEGEIYVATKLGVLLGRMKQYERGYAYGREVLARAWDSDAWLCYQVGWIASGTCEQFPVDPAHRDLDLALRAARQATELEPLDYHLTMLAAIHALRGEPAQAAAAQRRAIAALEAKRERIPEPQLEEFEAELAGLKARLAEYERNGGR